MKDLIVTIVTSSIVSTIVQVIYENKRNKNQRRSDLDKEIYFRKIEAWQEISKQIKVIDSEIANFNSIIYLDDDQTKEYIGPIVDLIFDPSTIEVWFSEDVENAWFKMGESCVNMQIIVRDFTKQNKMLSEDTRKKYVEASKLYEKAKSKVKEKIKLELEKGKEKIIR